MARSGQNSSRKVFGGTRRLGTSHIISRNFSGTPFRTFAVVVALAVIVSLVFSTIVLAIGVQRSAELETHRLGADVVVLPPTVERVQSFGPAYETLNVAPNSTKYIDLSVQVTISNITGISRLSPQVYVGSLNKSRTSLVAFDPQTDFAVLPWLDERPPDIQPNDAFAGSGTGLTSGQILQAKGLTLKIVGVLGETNSGIDRAVFFPIQTAYNVVQGGRGDFPFKAGQISVIFVKLKPDYPPEIIARDIGLRIPDFKVAVALGIERRASLEIGGVPVYQLLVESVVGAALVVLVAFLFSTTINERKRQLGLLRSVGASKRFIFWLVLIEACIIALIGSVAGLGIGSALVYFGEVSLIHLFKISYLQPSLFDVLLLMGPSILLGVGIGAVAALYPAVVASRLDPYEAIRGGE